MLELPAGQIGSARMNHRERSSVAILANTIDSKITVFYARLKARKAGVGVAERTDTFGTAMAGHFGRVDCQETNTLAAAADRIAVCCAARNILDSHEQR